MLPVDVVVNAVVRALAPPDRWGPRQPGDNRRIHPDLSMVRARLASALADDELPGADPWDPSREWQAPPADEAKGYYGRNVDLTSYAPGSIREKLKFYIKRFGPYTTKARIVDLADGTQLAEVDIINRTVGKVMGRGSFRFKRGNGVPVYLVPNRTPIRLGAVTGQLEWGADRTKLPATPYLRGGGRGGPLTPDTIVDVVGDPEPYAESMALMYAANDYEACMSGAHPDRCATKADEAVSLATLWPPKPRARSGLYTPTEIDSIALAARELPEVVALMNDAASWPGAVPKNYDTERWPDYAKKAVWDRVQGLQHYLGTGGNVSWYKSKFSEARRPEFLRSWRTSPDYVKAVYDDGTDVNLSTIAQAIARVRRIHDFVVEAGKTQDPAEVLAIKLRHEAAGNLHIEPEIVGGLLRDRGVRASQQSRRKMGYLDEDEISLYDINAPADIDRWRDQQARSKAAEQARQAEYARERQGAYAALATKNLDGLTPQNARFRLAGPDGPGKGRTAASLSLHRGSSSRGWYAKIDAPKVGYAVGPTVKRQEDAIPALVDAIREAAARGEDIDVAGQRLVGHGKRYASPYDAVWTLFERIDALLAQFGFEKLDRSYVKTKAEEAQVELHRYRDLFLITDDQIEPLAQATVGKIIAAGVDR